MSARKPRFVLDSFALLALFRAETGGLLVRELVGKASSGDAFLSMATVNLGEVFYRTIRERGFEQAHEMLARVRELGIEIVDVDQELALMAARLKAANRIGYADCIAAALCQHLGASLVTGDADFQQIPDLDVTWLPSE